MFNKYFPTGFVIEKPWPFLETVSYINDILPLVLLSKNTLCFECVLGREKEQAIFDEMLPSFLLLRIPYVAFLIYV